MKILFYWKLAATSIYKNRSIYVPYILSCIGMIMMEYIVIFLASDQSVANLPGGTNMQMFISMGMGIIAVFAMIFLFYTNAFLMRRRKREFGLYSILGMGRSNLILVLLWESIFIAVISIVIGISLGILFSKGAQLLMVYMLQGSGGFSMTVPVKVIQITCLIFLVIFLLIFLNGLRQVWCTKPIELLKSESVGEKPPKANWVVAVLGLAILLAGYIMARTIEDPMTALLAFFLAAVLVVIGTYMLFISGSVVLCRLLKLNKSYYYKTSHFISVSSMSYRMKRNGAGLASICVLSTAVLIMISSTASLYFGMENLLRHRYPRNIVVDMASTDKANVEQIRAVTAEVLDEYGAAAENILEYDLLDLSGCLVDEQIVFNTEQMSSMDIYSSMRQLFIISLDDYNRLTGNHKTLAEDEILLYATKTDYTSDTLTVEGMGTYRISEHLDSFVENGIDTMQVIPSMFIFVPDLIIAGEKMDGVVSAYDPESIDDYKRSYYGFDLDCDKTKQIHIYEDIKARLDQLAAAGDFPEVTCESVAKEKDVIYAMYGGLFFLGILLGIVCILAAVMIMYYKQVSEGYEDKERFAILQKVGLTRKEIGKIINSQVLTVFFAPLVAAGIHMGVAFKIVSLLLYGFGLYNTAYIVCVTFICFLIFALFYAIVYVITSKAYYRIVSGGSQDRRGA